MSLCQDARAQVFQHSFLKTRFGAVLRDVLQHRPHGTQAVDKNLSAHDKGTLAPATPTGGFLCLLRKVAHAVDDLLPIWAACVTPLPSDAAGDAIRMHVHRRKVIQRREPYACLEVSLHCSVAGVVVCVACRQRKVQGL